MFKWRSSSLRDAPGACGGWELRPLTQAGGAVVFRSGVFLTQQLRQLCCRPVLLRDRAVSRAASRRDGFTAHQDVRESGSNRLKHAAMCAPMVGALLNGTAASATGNSFTRYRSVPPA